MEGFSTFLFLCLLRDTKKKKSWAKEKEITRFCYLAINFNKQQYYLLRCKRYKAEPCNKRPCMCFTGRKIGTCFLWVPFGTFLLSIIILVSKTYVRSTRFFCAKRILWKSETRVNDGNNLRQRSEANDLPERQQNPRHR